MINLAKFLGKRAKELYNARLVMKDNLKDISIEEFIYNSFINIFNDI